jgi:hypothetical protein
VGPTTTRRPASSSRARERDDRSRCRSNREVSIAGGGEKDGWVVAYIYVIGVF